MAKNDINSRFFQRLTLRLIIVIVNIVSKNNLQKYLGPDIVIAWFLYSFTEILCGQQYYGMDPSVCALDAADDFVFSCNSIGSEIQTGKSSEKHIVSLVKQPDR